MQSRDKWYTRSRKAEAENLICCAVPGHVMSCCVESENWLHAQVLINERSVKELALINSGDIAFEFSWQLGDDPRVSIKPEAGSVGPGERIPCELCYNPHAPHVLERYKVSCHVQNGSTFLLHLSGIGQLSQRVGVPNTPTQVPFMTVCFVAFYWV